MEVKRTIDIARPPIEVWRTVTDRHWLGEPSGPGVVHTDEGRRHMEVTEVDEPRRWGFSWWPAGAPFERTDVVVELEPADDGQGTTVTVTERAPDRPDRPVDLEASDRRGVLVGA